jgi:hypothetical protein
MNEFQSEYQSLKKKQMANENAFLTDLNTNTGARDLITREADIESSKNQILFKVTTEIEDCKQLLKESEDLVKRLKKHLIQLENTNRNLTR